LNHLLWNPVFRESLHLVSGASSKLYELAHKIPSMEKERREKTI